MGAILSVVALVLLLIIGSVSDQKQQQQAGDTNLTSENYTISYVIKLYVIKTIYTLIIVNIY